MSMTLHVGYAISCLVLLGIFVLTVTAQLRSKSFHPLLYWAVILSTSTAGTTMSDFMDRTLSLGYTTGTIILFSLLMAVLAIWRLTTGSLSVSNVKSVKEESFYWTAILISNTLGTALGDFLADSSGLGFAGGALLIGALLAVVTAANYFSRGSKVMLFWIAFVLTRPFGATMGDLLTKTPDKGGIGLGTVGSSIVLLAILVGLILWTNRTNSATQEAKA